MLEGRDIRCNDPLQQDKECRDEKNDNKGFRVDWFFNISLLPIFFVGSVPRKSKVVRVSVVEVTSLMMLLSTSVAAPIALTGAISLFLAII